MDFKGPLAKYPYKPNCKRSIGMVAGGTGITPMLQVGAVGGGWGWGVWACAWVGWVWGDVLSLCKWTLSLSYALLDRGECFTCALVFPWQST